METINIELCSVERYSLNKALTKLANNYHKFDNKVTWLAKIVEAYSEAKIEHVLGQTVDYFNNNPQKYNVTVVARHLKAADIYDTLLILKLRYKIIPTTLRGNKINIKESLFTFKDSVNLTLGNRLNETVTQPIDNIIIDLPLSGINRIATNCNNYFLKIDIIDWHIFSTLYSKSYQTTLEDFAADIHDMLMLQSGNLIRDTLYGVTDLESPHPFC